MTVVVAVFETWHAYSITNNKGDLSLGLFSVT
jgi:hypothetical protein